MIQITINSKKQDLKDGTTISSLLKYLSKSENGIAIAINEQVIPKTEWINSKLNENDQVLIIQATQGG